MSVTYRLIILSFLHGRHKSAFIAKISSAGNIFISSDICFSSSSRLSLFLISANSLLLLLVILAASPEATVDRVTFIRLIGYYSEEYPHHFDLPVSTQLTMLLFLQ